MSREKHLVYFYDCETKEFSATRYQTNMSDRNFPLTEI
jgi:hypothetical protein